TGSTRSTSACGRGMTCTLINSPTLRAAAAPASVAALTAPTSPRTKIVTYPAPIYSFPRSVTFAALTIASAASTAPTKPLVSTIPSASRGISCVLTFPVVEIKVGLFLVLRKPITARAKNQEKADVRGQKSEVSGQWLVVSGQKYRAYNQIVPG